MSISGFTLNATAMRATMLFLQEGNLELPIAFLRFTGRLNYLKIKDSCKCFECLEFIFFRQVIIVLTQLEGSGGFSIAHRLTHRLANSGNLLDWGPPDTQHCPPIDIQVEGLHSPRLIT